MRLHQELVLGIGGVRAIRALGLAPAVWHLNEGHSAFLLAERARELRGRPAGRSTTAWDDVPREQRVHDPHAGLGRQRALRCGPRPAGRRAAARTTAASRSSASSSSGSASTGTRSQFDMTAFSLRLTNGANAVSHLHAETANATWSGVIDRPILGITNGIHGPTWIGDPVAELLERLDADLDDLDASTESRPVLGAPRADPGARPVGGAPAPEARARPLRARPPAQPVRPPRRGADGARRARDRARPGRS